MRSKDEYVAQMKATLDEWNARIDELDAKARQARARASQDYNDQIATLKSKRDEARKKLREVESASGDVWKSVAEGSQRIWNDLKQMADETRQALAERLNK